MNRALNIKNWRDGGNNYVLKANSENKWCGFQKSVIDYLFASFGEKFNIVIWTDEQNADDYYCIPFKIVRHVFVDEHKTTGKYPDRWTAVILNHKFMMHSNSELAIDISEFYAKPILLIPTAELDNDFFIENAKAEINIRLGQSKFRMGVLKNFGYKCALSGITEQSLLTASHVIPWSHRKEFRGDISNGICLYDEYDALFDKGFISFTDDLEVIITSDTSAMSRPLAEKLRIISRRQLSQPLIKLFGKKYLEYHRKNIFKG
ncbi:hypothetical protein GCM10023189_00030 [Nibrella saemangeumensis]|uniref:HNH nuclease domain-containing protein n=1 Tax=Nibrella saemangeumensis TaxID=1084526 RepID=A0ABP8M787_9BACT